MFAEMFTDTKLFLLVKMPEDRDGIIIELQWFNGCALNVQCGKPLLRHPKWHDEASELFQTFHAKNKTGEFGAHIFVQYVRIVDMNQKKLRDIDFIIILKVVKD